MARVLAPLASKALVRGGDISSWGIGVFVAFMLLLGISVTVPQLLFKSAERTLEVGPEGLSTRIGLSSLATGGSALLIPSRAFESEGQRRAFMDDVSRWGGGHG